MYRHPRGLSTAHATSPARDWNARSAAGRGCRPARRNLSRAAIREEPGPPPLRLKRPVLPVTCYSNSPLMLRTSAGNLYRRCTPGVPAGLFAFLKRRSVSSRDGLSSGRMGCLVAECSIRSRRALFAHGVLRPVAGCSVRWGDAPFREAEERSCALALSRTVFG